MEKFVCPVCGHRDLVEPAWDITTGTPSFNICPCCGCEFGYEDATPKAKNRYLLNWIKKGAIWFKPDLKPANWDLREQLKYMGVNLDEFV